MIIRTPSLDDAEVAVVRLIDESKARLGYALQPRRWTGLLRRNTFARAVRGSNSIEGYLVTIDDAIAAVEGDEPLAAEPEAWKAVVGYRKAMTFVLQKADDPYFTLSEEVLKALHFMMIEHDLGKNPGRWRPGPIFVRDDATGEVVYEGPPANDVPSLMAELVHGPELADDAVPLVVRAAMAHLNLVMIHPFSDGNGRVARCLQTLVLARGGVVAPAFSSIEEYLGRNTRDYYAVLAAVGAGRWSPSRDARPWVRFCLTAHYRQVVTLLRRSREIERLWSELEELVRRARLPERMLFALADAASGLRVTNASYRKAAEVTEGTGGRDLRQLVAFGYLEAHGERRGRFYRSTPALHGIFERTREERAVSSDPFARSRAPKKGR